MGSWLYRIRTGGQNEVIRNIFGHYNTANSLLEITFDEIFDAESRKLLIELILDSLEEQRSARPIAAKLFEDFSTHEFVASSNFDSKMIPIEPDNNRIQIISSLEQIRSEVDEYGPVFPKRHGIALSAEPG